MPKIKLGLHIKLKEIAKTFRRNSFFRFGIEWVSCHLTPNHQLQGGVIIEPCDFETKNETKKHPTLDRNNFLLILVYYYCTEDEIIAFQTIE